jgi:uridine kinase
MDKRAFVVGLAGPPGAGKTTLTVLLRNRNHQVRVVYHDRYQPLTKMPEAQVRAWFARGGDPNEIDHSELVADLQNAIAIESGAAHRPLVLFETPFGRLHRATGALIDFLVWVDTPLDIALARAVLAFTQIAQRESAPNAAREFILWQRQYMVNYPVVRSMYLAQRQRIAPNADLIVDGSYPAEVLAEQISAALAARGVGI